MFRVLAVHGVWGAGCLWCWVLCVFKVLGVQGAGWSRCWMFAVHGV